VNLIKRCKDEGNPSSRARLSSSEIAGVLISLLMGLLPFGVAAPIVTALIATRFLAAVAAEEMETGGCVLMNLLRVAASKVAPTDKIMPEHLSSAVLGARSFVHTARN
jgi:hypothetical protein